MKYYNNFMVCLTLNFTTLNLFKKICNGSLIVYDFLFLKLQKRPPLYTWPRYYPNSETGHFSKYELNNLGWTVCLSSHHLWHFQGGVSGFFDVSQEELRLNYYINRSNPQVHIENVQALSQKVTEARQRVANPQNKNQIYQETFQ